MIVLIVNGAPQAGKTTFNEMLKDMADGEVKIYSSIDYVKMIAFTLGWDGIKDDKGRKLLSDLKTLLTAYDDSPFNKVIQHMHSALANCKYFCTDIREPSEIQKMEDYCDDNNIPWYSLWIRNKAAEHNAQSLNNQADTQYMRHDYSYHVPNEDSKEFFERQIQGLMNRISKKETCT